MSKKRKVKHGLKRIIVEYGFHLWIVFFLVNVAVLYTVSYFSNAAPPSPTTDAPANELPVSTEITSEPTPEEPTPTQEPVGPMLSLSLSIPGIGSNAGNMTPVHPEREVFLYFYKPEDNSAHPKTKPVHSIKATIAFNTNTYTSNYTAFTGENIDLGALGVTEGRYQIVLRTDQSLRKIIKAKESDVAGQTIQVIVGGDFVIPLQKMVTGDIYPANGDNNLDINDYNAFVSCFGDKSLKASCPNRLLADLDDNGVVDGLDYNLLLISYRHQVSLGLPAVSLPTPTSTRLHNLPKTTPQTANTTKTTPTAKKETTNKTDEKVAGSNNSGFVTVLLTIFALLLLVGGGAFFVFKTKLLSKLKPKSDKDASETPADQTTETPSETTETPTTADANAQPEATPPADAPTETPTAPTPPAGTEGEVIEGEYMVRKKSVDEAKKGLWLSLTGDHGVLDGYYQAETVTEGFAKIKGVMKKDGDKTYVEISELTPSE